LIRAAQIRRDVGDYLKLALLRALSPGYTLGIAWSLVPDESHNSDGRHVSYLEAPSSWKHIDSDLFDMLRAMVRAATGLNKRCGTAPK
jgi:hypothetical protein